MFPYNNCTGNYHAAASPYDLTLHSQKAVTASASKYCFLVGLESAVPPPDLSNSERSCYKSLLNQLNRVAINTSEKCDHVCDSVTARDPPLSSCRAPT